MKKTWPIEIDCPNCAAKLLELYRTRGQEEEFCTLWASVWGEPPTLEQTRLAMQHTLFRVSVFDGDTIIAMAEAEGLQAHANAVKIRKNN